MLATTSRSWPITGIRSRDVMACYLGPFLSPVIVICGRPINEEASAFQHLLAVIQVRPRARSFLFPPSAARAGRPDDVAVYEDNEV